MTYCEVTLDSKVMKQFADCVEWCPINEFHHIFVCGTYQLTDDEHSQSNECLAKKRMGSLCLFEVTQKGLLEESQSLETPGILDIKWCPVPNSEGEPLLAVADSEGKVLLFTLQRNVEGKPSLSQLESFRCVEKEGALCLSLDWAATELSIAVSDSSGDISVLNLRNSRIEQLHRWNAHGHEAWVATFDNQDMNVIYSGGDDSKLVIYDIRQNSRLRCLTKNHEAGVTSLRCEENANILSSGSYDEVLRLWDKRNWKSAMDQIQLGGGVWKIKWNPHSRGNALLAACMHGGFQLVNYSTSNNKQMSKEFTYTNHGSLAYGCDWCHSETFCNSISSNKNIQNAQGLIATCSFYDSKLCLWLLYTSAINLSK